MGGEWNHADLVTVLSIENSQFNFSSEGVDVSLNREINKRYVEFDIIDEFLAKSTHILKSRCNPEVYVCPLKIFTFKIGLLLAIALDL